LARCSSGVVEMIQHGVDVVRLGLMLVVVLGISLIGRQIMVRALPKASAR